MVYWTALYDGQNVAADMVLRVTRHMARLMTDETKRADEASTPARLPSVERTKGGDQKGKNKEKNRKVEVEDHHVLDCTVLYRHRTWGWWRGVVVQ